jgi:hypothetical protein
MFSFRTIVERARLDKEQRKRYVAVRKLETLRLPPRTSAWIPTDISKAIFERQDGKRHLLRRILSGGPQK